MALKGIIASLLLVSATSVSYGQDFSSAASDLRFPISGFVRGGLYGDLKDYSGSQFISSAYADAGIKIDLQSGNSFRGLADLRFRYGAEFRESVSQVSIREAFVGYTGKSLSFSAGRKIIKWGRADFTNPTSKFNPQNYISRSPDREDMDLGNIVAEVNWFPSDLFSLQGIYSPFYTPSVLIIDPVPLPDYVAIEELPFLYTGDDCPGYGIRAGLHFSGIDIGASWFDGCDPMPGMKLDKFSSDLSQSPPAISATLKVTPYRIWMTGIDFEAVAGNIGLRGELAWSDPELSYREHEYVPLQEIKWVAGADFSAGSFRVSAEYSGKHLPDFTAPAADPIVGSEPDWEGLAAIMMINPAFDLEEYMRQQVGAFNRLYFYQLERNYHSAAIRIEGDLGYGKITPSIFSMYNFTSRDLLIMPELRLRPSDGITITIGAEIYSGRKGSLFDLVDDFMSCIYLGFKADF